MKHQMGWSDPEYDSSEESDGTVDSELCHPLCQCKKCAPAQRVSLTLLLVLTSAICQFSVRITNFWNCVIYCQGV